MFDIDSKKQNIPSEIALKYQDIAKKLLVLYDKKKFSINNFFIDTAIDNLLKASETLDKDIDVQMKKLDELNLELDKFLYSNLIKILNQFLIIRIEDGRNLTLLNEIVSISGFEFEGKRNDPDNGTITSVEISFVTASGHDIQISLDFHEIMSIDTKNESAPKHGILIEPSGIKRIKCASDVAVYVLQSKSYTFYYDD